MHSGDSGLKKGVEADSPSLPKQGETVDRRMDGQAERTARTHHLNFFAEKSKMPANQGSRRPHPPGLGRALTAVTVIKEELTDVD